jgi:GTP-binding protein LepA
MVDQRYIRNFSIIAHIDHGKSTLADRMLEITGTVPERKMKEQVLDRMELERERGITIKMAPVRMVHVIGGRRYILNLIDTPGHIDFSYEVSRALKAVEGVILLVDSTQGVQAQTLSTLAMAQDLDLVVIPVLSKIDAPLARRAEVKTELVRLLHMDEAQILETSGRTGEGVRELLTAITERVPPPRGEEKRGSQLGGLVFDFQYSAHQGVIVYVRIFDGEARRGDTLMFCAAKESFTAGEVGIFSPDTMPTASLSAGEIGYIVTGVKKPGIASVGDTIISAKGNHPPFPGYMTPKPVVWASVYPESQNDFPELRQALDRLKLSDSSLSYEEEQSGALGRGFRCGFLGMLHLEIITERLRREFGLDLVVATPSTTYEIEYPGGARETIYTPLKFPDHGTTLKIFEPWTKARIITPPDYLGSIMQVLHEHEAVIAETETFGDSRVAIVARMPLRELMRNFFDEIKSASSGFASLSYEIEGVREADVVRLDVLVAGEVVPALSRVVSRRRVQDEAEGIVERLHKLLPRQQFVIKIQAQALGRILSSRTLSAYRKDVTAKLYGGDVTRKKKLLEKQKKGKKKIRERGKVNIPHDVFLKVVREA